MCNLSLSNGNHVEYSFGNWYVVTYSYEGRRGEEVPKIHLWYRDNLGRRRHITDDSMRPFIWVPSGEPNPTIPPGLADLEEKEKKWRRVSRKKYRTSEEESYRLTKEEKERLNLGRLVRDDLIVDELLSGKFTQFAKTWENIGVDGDKLKQFRYRRPTDTYVLRKQYGKTYQAKVEFALNWLMCKNILYGLEIKDNLAVPAEPYPDIKPRLLYIDIEVDADEQVYPMADIHTEAIISIVLYDSYKEEYFCYLWHPDPKWKLGEPIKNVPLNGGTYTLEIYDNETEMVREALQKMKRLDPDYILGWNVEAFDLAYMFNRCKYDLGLYENFRSLSPLSHEWRAVSISDFDKMEKAAKEGKLSIAKRKRNEFYAKWQVRIKGRIVLDLLKAYKVLNQGVSRDSYRLDDIASHELGQKKVLLEKSVHKIWMETPKQLMKYNVRDVELIVNLNEKLGIVEHFEEMRKIAGIPVDDILSKISLCKYILLRATDRPLTTERIREAGETEAWKGGLLIVPDRLGHKVVGLDVRQMYPNIIIIFNISPDTVLGVYKNIEEYGSFVENLRDREEWLEKYKPIVVTGSSNLIYVFRTDIEGLIPSRITEFIRLRKARKKEMFAHEYGTEEYRTLNTRQRSYKHTTASMYGISSLLFEVNLGDPITGVGRACNQWTQDIVTEEGFDVIYADTDSVFYESKETELDKIIEEAEGIQRKINESYPKFLEQYGSVRVPELLEIEVKEVYRKIHFKGRRRYVGALLWIEGETLEKPKLFKIGVESKRSDTSRFARNLMDEIYEDWLIEERTVPQLVEAVKEARRKMFNGDFRYEDFGFPSGLQKLIKDYTVRRFNKATGEWRTVPLNHPRIRSRIYSNKYFGTHFDRGSHVKILYLTSISPTAKYPETDCIALEVDENVPKDFWETHKVNYDRMAVRNIENRLKSIFEAEGIKFGKGLKKKGKLRKETLQSFEEFIVGSTQQTLFQFS